MLNESDYERANQLALSEVEDGVMRSRLALQASATEDGRCDDCDDLITPARLAAYPSARRCVSCQEDHELRERTHGY
ncbi:MAG: TraR/DksA C4-type zinc finger protein [Marinobacter sp.]|nr:TraR/DksA C4-type zinc finger protein [Marinobacter sp.]